MKSQIHVIKKPGLWEFNANRVHNLTKTYPNHQMEWTLLKCSSIIVPQTQQF